MKVTMLVDTYYGAPLKKDAAVDVPKDVADRWIKNNIAATAEPPKRLAKRDDHEGGAE